MGPKKVKTRHSVLSCAGPSAPLPDTVRDVLAALEMLKISNPAETNWWLCGQIILKVRAKWAETNPMLVLIKDASISKTILKNYDTALLINQNKAKVEAETVFHG